MANQWMLANTRHFIKLYARMGAQVCQKHGLNRLEMDVIAFLTNNPSLDTARDISQMRVLPKSNVSQAVELLMRKGLIDRMPDRLDRRRIHLALTEDARGVAQEIRAMQFAFEEALFEGFTEEERGQFEKMIDRLSANAAKGSEGK